MDGQNRTYVIDKENREFLDELKDKEGVDKSFAVRRALMFYREKVIKGDMVDRKYEARRE